MSTRLLKMPFTDDSLGGVTFQDAVWDVVSVQATTEGVGITAYVYANAEARNNKQPLAGGFPKSVSLGAETLSDPQFAQLVETVKQAAWSILRSHPSLLVGPAPAEGEPDMRENYFARGQMVEV